MEARRLGDGFQLTIAGPGKERRTMHFSDLTALIQHHAQIEARLITDGFTLDQFLSDRRRVPR
jgi:hypothetical protein